MAQLAAATGGMYFHDNNDLLSVFGELSTTSGNDTSWPIHLPAIGAMASIEGSGSK